MKAIIQIILALTVFSGCSLNKNYESYKQIHDGKISGYAYDEYKLQLFKNDKLTTNISTHKLNVIIYSPINQSLENQSPINIESEGEYILRVLMPRAFARRNEEYEYRLSITVDRN